MSDDDAAPGWESLCDCQYGPCGHCTAGRHQHCSYPNNVEFYEAERPITWLLAGPGRHTIAPVWGTGRWCAWRCPCHVAGHPGSTPAQRAATAAPDALF